MAFGQHWEWRGFGALPMESRRRIESLPPRFPRAQELTDRYLWSARSKVNVKLRHGDLKFKRLVRQLDDLEEWLEDRDENHPFPLGATEWAKLASVLDVDLGAPPAVEIERDGLLAAIERLSEVKVIDVTKRRQQFSLDILMRDEMHPVIVELAEISAPERIVSVGIENEERELVERARVELDLGPEVVALSYFDALGRWARGFKIDVAAGRQAP